MSALGRVPGGAPAAGDARPAQTTGSGHGPRWHFEDVRDEDVYIVSFPRSGNTWLRYLIGAHRYGAQMDPSLLATALPDIHQSDPRRRPSASPLVVKTHMPPFAGPLPARIVYLVRHGLDATVSYHHYLLRRGRIRAGTPIEDFLSGDMWPCRWAAHVEGWLDRARHRTPRSWLLVHYEDLRSDPARELGRVLRFLRPEDVAPGEDVPLEAVAIEEAVRLSGRRRMLQHETAAGEGSLNFVGAGGSPALAEAAVERFLAEAGPALARLGYPERWPAS